MSWLIYIFVLYLIAYFSFLFRKAWFTAITEMPSDLVPISKVYVRLFRFMPLPKEFIKKTFTHKFGDWKHNLKMYWFLVLLKQIYSECYGVRNCQSSTSDIQLGFRPRWKPLFSIQYVYDILWSHLHVFTIISCGDSSAL